MANARENMPNNTFIKLFNNQAAAVHGESEVEQKDVNRPELLSKLNKAWPISKEEM